MKSPDEDDEKLLEDCRLDRDPRAGAGDTDQSMVPSTTAYSDGGRNVPQLGQVPAASSGTLSELRFLIVFEGCQNKLDSRTSFYHHYAYLQA